MATNTDCIEFQNDAGYLSIAHASQTGLDFTGNFTAAWWHNFGTARISGGGGNRSVILSKYDSTGGYEMGFVGLVSNAVGFYVLLREDASTVDEIQFTGTELGEDGWLWANPLVDGIYSHVAVRVNYSGGNPAVSLFVNGNLIDTDLGSNTTSIGTNTAEFAVGARSGGPTGVVYNIGNTRLDELKVWDAALPDDLIIETMRDNFTQTATQGYWNFNSQLWDNSGNLNDLSVAAGTQTYETDLPFTIYGRTQRYRAGSGDGYVANTDNGWDTTRNASSGDSANPTTTSMLVGALSAQFSAEVFNRGFVPVDTSGQSTQGDVLDAYIKLTST